MPTTSTCRVRGGRARAAADGPPLARRPASRADLGRARPTARARRDARRARPGAAGSPSAGSERCTSRPTPTAALAAARRRGRRARRLDAPRGRRAGPRRLRDRRCRTPRSLTRRRRRRSTPTASCARVACPLVTCPERRRRALQLDDDELVACVACGLCLPHCPTYRVTGLEIASPRGRIAAMRAVQLDGAPIDDAFVGAMEECVQCRGCEAGVPVVGAVRSPDGGRTRGAPACTTDGALVAPTRRPSGSGTGSCCPRHRLLLAVTWFLWSRSDSGWSRGGSASRGSRCGRSDDHSGSTPPRRRRVALHRVRDGRLAARRPPLGARRDARHRCERRGTRARAATCCGALHVHAGRARRSPAARPSGDRGDARRRAGGRRQRRLRRDDEGLRATAGYAGGRARSPARVRDFSEWVVATGVAALMRADRDDDRRAGPVPPAARAARRSGAVRGAARETTYDLAETDDDGLCCGAGGAYAVLQPALSGEIRDRKVVALQRRRAGDSSAAGRCRRTRDARCTSAVAGVEVRHPAAADRGGPVTTRASNGRATTDG